MNEKKMLSIIVPVYNEEKNVPLFYEKVLPILNSLAYEWELIFINDGSRDKTESRKNDREVAKECNAPIKAREKSSSIFVIIYLAPAQFSHLIARIFYRLLHI